MNRFVTLVAFISVVLLLSACTTDKNRAHDREALGLDEPFPAASLEALAAIEETAFSPNEIVLPNGKTVNEFLMEHGLDGLNAVDLQSHGDPEEDLRTAATGIGPQAQKNLVLAMMSSMAYRLTSRQLFQFPEEPPLPGGVTRPAQYGLAYSYGGKEYSSRQVPPAGDCQSAAIYGLDCSGFIYQVARQASLKLPVGTAHRQSDPELWNAALAHLELNDLTAERIGQIPPSELQTGDLIYWYTGERVYHIGIVLRTADGRLSVFQSNGTDSGTCEMNYGPNRGPRQLDLTDPYWFGGGAGRWGVTRMVTDVESTWRVFGRCSAAEVDAFTMDIEIKSGEESQSVFGSGNGFDYDGSPLTAALSGSYNSARNTLSAQISFTFPDRPSSSRIDEFSTVLKEDNTGYFPARLVHHSSSGCDLELRLENLTTSPSPYALPGPMPVENGGPRLNDLR